MYAALAGGGCIDGVQLLSRETVRRASEPQKEAGRRVVIPVNLHWRLGYHGAATLRGFMPNAFGHYGFGGSGAWCDPSRELAVGMVVNCGMGTPFGDLRIVRMSGAVMDCVRKRSRHAARSRRPAITQPGRVYAET